MVERDGSNLDDDQHGTRMEMPARISGGCNTNGRDHDVGVVVRLDLDVVPIGFGLTVKRAEVATPDSCTDEGNWVGEARLGSRAAVPTGCGRVGLGGTVAAGNEHEGGARGVEQLLR